MTITDFTPETLRIWLMVVLIVGISLGGYIIYKFVGPKAGAWASGSMTSL
jgi:uncharacterized membrane protein (DUF4010 family)